MVAVLSPYEPTRPPRRADRREADARLKSLYDWLLRLSDQGGLYTGLDMWDKAGRGKGGHLVLINEMPAKMLVTATALGKIHPHYRQALDLKYAYLRDAENKEVSDFDRSLVAGVSESLYRTRVSRGRRYVQKAIWALENV